MGDGIEEIKVVPPAPGACRICAMKHDPKKPHDRDSLYKKILAQRGIILPDGPTAK